MFWTFFVCAGSGAVGLAHGLWALQRSRNEANVKLEKEGGYYRFLYGVFHGFFDGAAGLRFSLSGRFLLQGGRGLVNSLLLRHFVSARRVVVPCGRRIYAFDNLRRPQFDS